MTRGIAAAATAAFAIVSTGAIAQTRPINLEKSTITVLVYKSGLFSAFADDHVIRAPIASGSLSETVPLSIEIAVRAASLKVLDPKLSESRRDEVQTRMLSPEVLDTAKYADITFVSAAVVPSGPDKWTVTGQLTIHGQTRSITFPATRQDGSYRGTVPVSQRDFGISPISIGGGTVKVKDEVKVQFEIVP
jgi:polyisoprenoid-binding protein YceI